MSDVQKVNADGTPVDEGKVDDGAGGGEKTYTKAEYDALIKERDTFKTSHEQISDLYTNPRFKDFVEDENRRLALGEDEYNRLYGGEPDTKGGADDEPDLSQMSEEERVEYLVEQKLNERLKPHEEERAREKAEKARDNATAELNKLETDKETYPLFDKSLERDGQQIPVRTLMRQEIQAAMERGSIITMDHAYKIVTHDAQKNLGIEEREALLAKKREAAKLGIPVSSRGHETPKTPKKFENARQATEAVVDELGV